MTVCSRSEYQLGVVLLLASAITFSTAGLFTRGVDAGAWEIIFWRGLFAALLTTGWTIRRGTLRRNIVTMGISGWVIAFVGASGTAAFIPAFKLTSIANVSLIYAIAPLIAAILAWIFIGERASTKTLLGCFGALLGVIIIASGSMGQPSLLGDFLALWMTLAMAVIMVIYREFPDTPGPGPQVVQSLLLLPIAIHVGSPFSVPLPEVFVLAAFGLLFAIASVTLAEGAKRVPSGQTAFLSALETPLASVFAFALFLEMPGIATIVGGSLVLISVIVSIRRGENR